jgi:hypothetical protein
MPHTFRTTCVPIGNRLDTIIPNEYVGREVEVIVFPLDDESQPKYNAETLAAMQEARDIEAGKIKTKTYATVQEMEADLDAMDDE